MVQDSKKKQPGKNAITCNPKASDLELKRCMALLTVCVKGLAHPKMKITLMSFQAHKSSVHLRDTIQDILDSAQIFSVPPLKMYVRYTVLVQKGNKDIIKVVHVTSVLNKVIVFVIFGPKCIFDASKHCN